MIVNVFVTEDVYCVEDDFYESECFCDRGRLLVDLHADHPSVNLSCNLSTPPGSGIESRTF